MPTTTAVDAMKEFIQIYQQQTICVTRLCPGHQHEVLTYLASMLVCTL